MNLPTGYANLSVLSTFLHEARSTTINRALAGAYKTAKPYTKAKLTVWMIRQDELFEVMSKYREEVPCYIGRIDLRIKSEHMGMEQDEAETRLLKIMGEIEQTYGHLLDEDHTTYWVEEA